MIYNSDMTKGEVEALAKDVLEKIFRNNERKGLMAVYLWGSIITPEFDPENSDVDAVGILSDEAIFAEFNEMRNWLPSIEPGLKRLQINFFYLSELIGGPVRSNLARLASPEQAVFDFPYWKHVCGKKIASSDLPKVTAKQALKDQVGLTKMRMGWVKDGAYGDMGLEYFCKSLVWLCYNIHKLSSPPERFSWKSLDSETTDETKGMVEVLLDLKSKHWAKETIREQLPWLERTAKTLIAKYS